MQFKAQAYTFVHDLNSKEPLITKIFGNYDDDKSISSPSPNKFKSITDSPQRNNNESTILKDDADEIGLASPFIQPSDLDKSPMRI